MPSTTSTDQSQAKLLVVTDLDATLLDHTYSWEPARPAIETLKARNFPLVLNSSKTLLEMSELAEVLGVTAPLIAENGSVIAYPPSLADAQPSILDLPLEAGHHIQFLGISRQDILTHAHKLRATHNYQFAGFADWTAADVAERTGLSTAAAKKAHARVGTEPIIWSDTDQAWQTFETQLADHEIRAVRGGRFIHLMGRCDKAMGLKAAAAFYAATEPDVHWYTAALGDSANDLDMLSAADVAVVIPNDHHSDILNPTAPRIIRATDFGPTGWNKSIKTILNTLTPSS